MRSSSTAETRSASSEASRATYIHTYARVRTLELSSCSCCPKTEWFRPCRLLLKLNPKEADTKRQALGQASVVDCSALESSSDIHKVAKEASSINACELRVLWKSHSLEKMGLVVTKLGRSSISKKWWELKPWKGVPKIKFRDMPETHRSPPPAESIPSSQAFCTLPKPSHVDAPTCRPGR